VGWFDLEEADYRRIPILEHCEVSSAIGEVATGDDGSLASTFMPYSAYDGSMRGGHLLNGLVRPTLEVALLETPGALRRRKRRDRGIALIDLDA